MSTDITLTVKTPLLRCGHCGYYVAATEENCPNCQLPVDSSEAYFPKTVELTHGPRVLPTGLDGFTPFSPSAEVVLQVLPAGACLKRQLRDPLFLGRGNLGGVLDLTAYNAVQHGVSRCHCVLQPRSDRLTVTDLGSSNGTYLNDQRLVPRQPYFLTNGDRLILGTLHLIVSFGTGELPES